MTARKPNLRPVRELTPTLQYKTIHGYKRAYRIARALEAGTIWINTYKLFSISTPFSGWKESGMGREKGRLGIREYMQQKSLYWGLNDAPLAWAN